MHRPFAISSVLLVVACQGGGSGPDRMATKVAEVERTVMSGGTTTIDKTTVQYDGSRITQIAQFHNGAAAGTAKVTYGANGIDKIEYTDKEGDRALDQLTYVDGRLAKNRYEITGVSVDEDVYSYQQDRKDLVREIMSTFTPAGATATTALTKYEYDAEGRTTKATFIRGTTTSSTEYRYDTQGRIDRVTTFSGSSVLETYTFSYLPDGNLDEVVDSKNNRYELTYDDKNGRITEIRLITTGAITTTRYTYASGSADGWTFAPDLPAANFFDLGGNPYATIELMHGTIEIDADIPKAPGGGGGGGVCTGFEPVDACDTCLASSCCTQTKNCLQGTACYSFYECAQPCTTQACVDSCRSQNPAGSSAYDAFASCAQSFCNSQCAQ